MHVLADGNFGDSYTILANAAPTMERFGVPAELSATFAVHPIVDNSVASEWSRINDCESAVLSTDMKPDFFEPVLGNSAGVERWFERNHPADPALEETVGRFLEDNVETAAPALEPSTAFRKTIEQADEMLSDVLPEVWQHTKPFVTRLYEVPDSHLAGASWSNLGGVVMLGSVRNQDVQGTAASLLHEAAHNKSYRIFRGFMNMFGPKSGDFIEIPWWRTATSSKFWDVDRALVAAHVYCHLANLSSTFLDKVDGADEHSLRALQRTAFRSRYLSNILLQLDEYWLDRQRRDFVRWTADATPEIPGLNDAGRAALQIRVDSFAGAADALEGRRPYVP